MLAPTAMATPIAGAFAGLLIAAATAGLADAASMCSALVPTTAAVQWLANDLHWCSRQSDCRHHVPLGFATAAAA